uniref:Peptidase_M13_N domain-containing protein n=1 Tax=Strongyloides venezuelensis TaxID=75913 RepID=A0A0K0FFR3_STRVS
MSNLSSFNTIVNYIDNGPDSILDYDYLDSSTHNISQSTINNTIVNSDTKTYNDTILNTIDNSTELNYPPLNEVRNMNLYKQFSAILLNEHTFKTRVYEEIDNRQNKNLKNAMLKLNFNNLFINIFQNLLKQFESCKTPVYFSTLFTNNWNTLQKDIPELCQIKRIERERKKLYFFDSIRVLQGIENIKKYYKELNKSQFGENDSFEKIINDIFIYYDHDLPIISWNNIEQKTNGLVWRELPFKRYALFLGTTFLSEFDTLEEGIILWVQLNQLCEKINFFAMKFQALGKLNDKQIKGLFNMIEDIIAYYSIDLKWDLEFYLEKENFIMTNDTLLLLMNYGDDIDTNRIGSSHKDGILTHVGYKIIHPNLKTSKLSHIRTYSVIESDKVKPSNYITYMRLILSNFTDLNVVYKEKTFKVKVIGILGDNEFLQMLHKHKRNWLARGMNNCRTCTVDEDSLHKISYKTLLTEDSLQNITYRRFLTKHFLQKIPYKTFLTEDFLQKIPYITFLTKHSLQNIPYIRFLTEDFLQNISYRTFFTKHFLQNIPYRTFLTEHFLQNILYRTFLTEHSLQKISYKTFLTEHSLQKIPYITFLTEHSLQKISYKTFLTEHSLQNIPYRRFLTEHFLQKIPYITFLTEDSLQNISYITFLT